MHSWPPILVGSLIVALGIAALVLLARVLRRNGSPEVTVAFAYSQIVENMQIGIVVLRLEDLADEKSFRMVAANPAASSISTLPLAQIIDKPLMEVVPNLYQTPLPRAFAEVVRTGLSTDIGEITYGDERVPQGSYGLKAFALPDRCVGISFENVTERKKMADALRARDADFARLIHSNIIGLVLIDAQGLIVEANEYFLEMLGYSHEDVKEGRLHNDALTPKEYHSVDEWVKERVKTAKTSSPVEKEFICKNGSRLPVLYGAVPIENNRLLCFVINVMERRLAMTAMQKAYDELETRVQERTEGLSRLNQTLSQEVDQRRRTEAELFRLSVNDSLTGLYNRRGFMELARQLHNQARQSRQRFTVALADLDNLKKINDKLGHLEGDVALKQVSAILTDAFTGFDVVGRFGGDEFIVAVVTDESVDPQAWICSRMDDRVKKLNASQQKDYALGISIGLCSAGPDDRRPLEDLIAAADEALYAKKRDRKMAA